jgi:hypothetical protein
VVHSQCNLNHFSYRKIDEIKAGAAPEETDPPAQSQPEAHRQFIVTVTKVERRGGRKHAVAVETPPLESPKAEHFLPPSSEAEDDEITQKLKRKRDQFLQRRMSSVRIPSSNFREVSPIAAAMGYDSTMSHDEIEDEIDYHAVTMGHKQSTHDDPDSDYYNDSSEDEELPLESPSNVESIMRQVRLGKILISKRFPSCLLIDSDGCTFLCFFFFWFFFFFCAAFA